MNEGMDIIRLTILLKTRKDKKCSLTVRTKQSLFKQDECAQKYL